MESVLIDQSPLNPRKSVGVNNSSGYGGFMTRPSSISSVSQIFLNLNAGAGTGTGSGKASFGLFGSRPPPPRHFSLPSFSVTPSVVSPPPPFPPPTPPLHQPPLLPLPFSKSATLPSPTPTKRIAAAVTTARSRDHRKKTRPAANPARKDPPRSPAASAAPSDPPKGESASSAVPQKPPQKPASPPAAKAEWEEEVEEGAEAAFAMESVYSLSPPPSSLPLPTFFLKRPKAAAAAASCIAEAMGCGGGGGSGGARVNAGATDDLRRLLRL